MLSAQDTGSYLAITLGSALVHSKRNFDRQEVVFLGKKLYGQQNMLPSNFEIVFHQGDAAANEEHRGGKATKTQVPALDL